MTVRRGLWRALLAASRVVALAFALRPLAPGQNPENWFPYSDKLLHVGFFAALWWLARRADFAHGLALALVLLAFGVAIEAAQAGLTLTREASALDVLADVAGIALGWTVAARLTGPVSSRRQPEEHGR